MIWSKSLKEASSAEPEYLRYVLVTRTGWKAEWNLKMFKNLLWTECYMKQQVIRFELHLRNLSNQFVKRRDTQIGRIKLQNEVQTEKENMVNWSQKVNHRSKNCTESHVDWNYTDNQLTPVVARVETLLVIWITIVMQSFSFIDEMKCPRGVLDTVNIGTSYLPDQCQLTSEPYYTNNLSQ